MSDNMDQLLDETLDDLADLPSSSPFVPGAHVCTMYITKPDAKKSGFYAVKFKHTGTAELTDPTANPPKADDEAVLFIHTKKKDGTANDFGQGQLKMILTPLAEKLQTKSISQLIEATKSGIEVAIVSGIREQKDTNYPPQMTLVKIQMV
jgi:hypothetical protein